MNNEPFALRGDDQKPEWWVFVDGRQFGPWPDKGAAMAGYQTELRRAERRANKASQAETIGKREIDKTCGTCRDFIAKMGLCSCPFNAGTEYYASVYEDTPACHLYREVRTQGEQNEACGNHVGNPHPATSGEIG